MIEPLSEKLIPIREEKNTLSACNYTSWTAEGFALTEALKQINGPVIEIAGPTLTGYPNIFPDMEYANRLPTGQRILISNISYNYRKPKGVDESEFTKEDLEYLLDESFIGKLDFLCDGTMMPFADKSVGAVLFSHLQTWPRKRTIEEAVRTIKNGGLLIAQGISGSDMEFAKTLGFMPKMIYTPDNPNRSFDAVFVKE